jgi:hypothetical protein
MNNVYVVNLESAFIPAGVAGVELSVGGTVAVFPEASVPDWNDARAKTVLVGVQTNDVKFTLDGTDPATVGAGIVLAKGIHYWSYNMVRAAKFIEAGGSAAGVIRFEAGV